MVKSLTQYRCEICGKKYDKFDEAFDCEARGKEEPVLELHQEILLLREMGGGWDNWWLPVRVGEIEDKGHYIYYQLEEEDREGNWEYASYGAIYGNNELDSKTKPINVTLY